MSLITSQETKRGGIEDSNSAQVVPDDVGADAVLGIGYVDEASRREVEVGRHEEE